MRVFVYIAYKGTHYHGWQIQKNAMSIQEEITKSFHTLLKNKEISISGSGRTDTGVHAIEQVFHVDIPDTTDTNILQFRLNSLMPNDIVVNKIIEVDKEAHARFSAISRSYEYHLSTHRTPFYNEEHCFYPASLDVKLMNEAAGFLLGNHNFQSFSKVKTAVKNFFCTITRAEWIRNDNKIIFYISANRFLRGMVRTIVGTLLQVGEKKIQPVDVITIIKAKNRATAGKSVPCKGLYLCKVEYSPIINKVE